MHFLALTTVDSGEPERYQLFLRLVASLEQQRQAGIEIVHYVLLQRAEEGFARDLEEAHPWMRLYRRTERLTLSRARNILLAAARASGDLDSADVAAFPDDDAWYPDALLQSIGELYASDNSFDLFICKYGSAPVLAGRLDKSVEAPSLLSFVQTASSNTLFFRARFLSSLGDFDEALGVGAPLGGGEDLDIALRAHSRSGKILACPLVLIGHRDKSYALRAKYFRGDMFVLARHAPSGAAYALLYLRKFLVGLHHVAYRRLDASAWVGSVLISGKELLRSLRQA